ncbi:Triosephosphate isomerase [Sodiomyces alkalinus F11]|uniref:Triosephosphate isomerase n=1 Tax=Sodiomyces alkalinus (strain CBS 110278 / VKM F-3762 / F11) TaxID=1314773 RepID=A0A3N2PWZ1_SODAK|nr:Triosephosphate isomerase [Sodiomyces alkalinus F11]ROT39043.1 Triosephosphate isomerase [Sodiomyces alkalinus F11]
MTSTQPPRRRILGFSTKMYFSHARTKSYLSSILPHLTAEQNAQSVSSLDLFIIPDFLSLPSAVSQTRGSPLLVGAQDCHWDDTGAFTGEISPAVLAEVGVRIVELGHAERRRLFGETDESTARKAAAAARNGLIPLVCVGEVSRGSVDEAAREVAGQVEVVMRAVPRDKEVVLAYEPVWAIGAAEPAAADHVVGVATRLRALSCVADRRGPVRIVYGGSAGPGTFAKLKDGLDGLFLGRFAHDPEQFWKTIQEVATA